jgi:uncharacterized protein YjcR
LKPNFSPENASIFEEKGPIPYWMISNKLGCHINTVRNWMKSRMTSKQKADVLAAIAEIKQELAKAQ